MTTQSVDKNAGGASSLEGMESIFAIALKMAGNKDDKPKEEKLDPQSYENALNELAVSLSGSVDVDKRMLVGISGTDKNKDLFKTLVEYKLKEQVKDGKQPSLQEAISSATEDLRNRSEHALRDDQDGDKKADVLNGYWDRQKGKDQAAELGAHAYQNFFNKALPDTANTHYDDNLNALASALVGGTNVDKRTLAVAIGVDGPLAEVYKNLIVEKLKKQGSPTNLNEAKKEVEKELFERIGNAAGNSPGDRDKIVDVIKGYWDRHAGKDDADGLAREAYEEFKALPTPPDKVSEIDKDIDYDDTLNEVASKMADGVNTGNRTVTPFTDKSVRDAYASLIHDKLEQQKERGDPVNLDAAYDEVKKELYERLPNALRDDPDGKEKMTILNNYWDKHSGKANAGDVAREAFARFIADNTLTDNPSYEDNLNAIATLLGGGTIDDTRTLSGLKDPTIKKLYENLITEKLMLKGDDKVPLDKAIEAVKQDIIERLGSALQGDAIKDEKITMVNNYFDKHGGDMDAKRAAEDAYRVYVEAGEPSKDGELSDEQKKNLLAPSSTDIMNAETADGKTVNQLYMEKLEALYKDEPEGSDKHKFLLLMQAQNSMAGGFGFLPYWYDKTNNITNYADDPAAMTGEEFLGLIDEDKLQEEIEKLAGDESIAADTDKLMKQAVGEIKDKKGLEDRIVSTMTSPTYKDELERADAAAENGALMRYSSDLNSLAMLNPEKAQEIKQELSMTSTVEELNKIIEAGPAGIDESTLDTAVDDVVLTTVKAAVLGSYFGEAAGTLSKAFDDYMDGKKLDELTKDGGKYLSKEEMQKLKDAKSAVDTVKTMVKDSLKTTITVEVSPTDRGWLKAIDQLNGSDLDKKINAALEKNKIAPEARGKVGEMIKGLASDGVFGTVGALVSVVAATMTLTEAGGNDAATPAERMTAAFYLLFAVSSSPTAVSAIGDPLAKLLGKNGVTQVLGLDKNMSDVLKGRLVPETNLNIKNPANASNLFRDINANIRTPGGNQILDAFNKMPPGEQSAIMKSVDKMAKSMGTAYANMSTADKLKLFGPGLKLVANSAYLGGSLLGVYMGADAIAKFDENTTDTEKAQAALSLTAGLAWTGAAGAAFAGWAGAGAVAGTVGTALGGVGIVLSVIGLGIASAIKYDKQKKAADEVRDYLTDLGELGVMENDWGDKFNYLAHVEYNYVSKDDPKLNDEWYDYYFPEDIPAWEAQPDQYKAFTETGGKTTSNWWSLINGDAKDLVDGHGKEPDGDRFTPKDKPAWSIMRG